MLNIPFRIVHQIADLLVFLWIGRRLKCPACESLGFWRPFGGWLSRAFGDNRGKRRWLCKWCGWYVDEGGFYKGVLYKGAPAWTLTHELTEEQKKTAYTPKEIFDKAQKEARGL